MRRPDRLAPGIAVADMAGAATPERSGDGVETDGGAADGRGAFDGGKDMTAGFTDGVGGPDDAGDGASTIHMRWERVATSLATVWARVEYGVMWNTGNESFPSLTPRSLRMTPMKWMQEDRRSGRDVVLVRS